MLLKLQASKWLWIGLPLYPLYYSQIKVEKRDCMSEEIKVPLCQSCAMPMDTPEKFGAEASGDKNEDYCCHCWKNGSFTYESTLEQAVESNIRFWKSPEESDDVARERIMAVFPKLKRWA